MNKTNRGGHRENAGRPKLPDKEKRKMYSFRISPENRAYLLTIPSGQRGELLNLLLDERRNKTGNV